MTADSLTYHAPTVLPTADEAASWRERTGETPLMWAGTGLTDFGLFSDDRVSMSTFEAVFDPAGARHPITGTRLVTSTRPGVELVGDVPKSVSILYACGRTHHALWILQADMDAQYAYLNSAAVDEGGRRGKAGRIHCGTHGLTMAVTRHTTSRAGDPYLHCHILIANLVTLAGDYGTRALRASVVYRSLMAAEATGQRNGQQMARDCGYRTLPVNDKHGQPTHWRIAGVPAVLDDLFSKRTAQMSEAADELHAEGKHASRRVLVAATRGANGPKNPDMAMLAARWRDEMTAAGWPPEAVLAAVDQAAQSRGAA